MQETIQMIKKWMGISCLLALLFVVAACGDSSAQPSNSPDSEVPGDFTHKTPSLPTTYLDTSGKVYAWHKSYNSVQSIQNRIPAPDGFQRVASDEAGFGDWLRGLPLKPGRPDVLLYNGSPKGYQGAQHAVIDMDVGERDLQQCADAVMRLRAEWLYSADRPSDIHFNFTSGDRCDWDRWRQGMRPKIRGNSVTWSASAQASDSYPNFKRYLNMVYNYAGTASLSKELKRIGVAEIRPGDVFIQGGFPGHAVMVVDVAENADGKKAFLLAQSYMPAQEMHVLVNPMDEGMSPWYVAGEGAELRTPEWTFEWSDLKRF